MHDVIHIQHRMFGKNLAVNLQSTMEQKCSNDWQLLPQKCIKGETQQLVETTPKRSSILQTLCNGFRGGNSPNKRSSDA